VIHARPGAAEIETPGSGVDSDVMASPPTLYAKPGDSAFHASVSDVGLPTLPAASVPLVVLR
jgi:hypothetical protein